MIMEKTIPIDLILLPAANKSNIQWEELIETWRMVDDNPDVDPKTTPLYKMYLRYKKVYKLVDKFDPYWHTAGKIDLYKKIKSEGFDPHKEVRIACNSISGKFYITEGLHRMSMLRHWKVKQVCVVIGNE